MRKALLLVICLLLLSSPAFAQESKETLTLKRDLMQERVARIQSQLELMRIQFREGQEAQKVATKELDAINAALKAMESAEKK